jgi:hypothetical protein
MMMNPEKMEAATREWWRRSCSGEGKQLVVLLAPRLVMVVVVMLPLAIMATTMLLDFQHVVFDCASFWSF